MSEKNNRKFETTYEFRVARNAEGDWAIQDDKGPWQAGLTYDSLESAVECVKRHFDEKMESRYDVQSTVQVAENGEITADVKVDQYEGEV